MGRGYTDRVLRDAASFGVRLPTRKDLVFPSDALTLDRVAYVHVKNPKTAGFAKRQHTRLEDPLTLSFLEARFGRLPLFERLYRGSLRTDRRQWNAIMEQLGVPFHQVDRLPLPVSSAAVALHSITC